MAAHPTARQGDRGPLVLALQVALARALGAHSSNRRNGVYGTRTNADVARWKRAQGISPPAGHYFGDRAWDRLLAKNATARVTALLTTDAEHRAAQAARRATTTEQQLRAAVVAEMEWLLAHAGSYRYAQVRPFPTDLRADDAHTRLDCSATVTDCYHGGGAPDPNGRGYDGLGFTGTLWVRGQRTYSPRPADLAFYGWDPRGWPEHVALHLDDPTDVGSFGHTPPTRYGTVDYRGDYIGSRTYL